MQSRNQLYGFVKQKIQFLKSILEKFFDIISKDKLSSSELLKQLCSVVSEIVKNCFTDTSRGYQCNDFERYLDRRCPYLTKEEYARLKRQEHMILYNKYLNSVDDFELMIFYIKYYLFNKIQFIGFRHKDILPIYSSDNDLVR